MKKKTLRQRCRCKCCKQSREYAKIGANQVIDIGNLLKNIEGKAYKDLKEAKLI